MTTRECRQCHKEKDILDFRHQQKDGRINISRVCKRCDTINGRPRAKKFHENHREQERERQNAYYADHKNEIKERNKDKKPVWDHNYYVKHKEERLRKNTQRNAEKYKDDPNYRIRHAVSRSISRAIKLSGHKKGGKSCLNYLPYTIQELKNHLESLFEPWMTWENYGRYKASKWDDNNQATWVWQIDHINPHSDYQYDSMDHSNFPIVWDLSNLRPYSAKQNWLDGIHRTRHKNGGKK